MEEKLKVALCAIVKNENLYIREWLEYYKKLGISKIFLYDNNEINGERLEDVIGDYISSSFVDVIDRRGKEKGLVYFGNINLQPLTYIDCYEDRLSDFDWVCFFDIDEFLEFRNGFDMFSFLQQSIFDDCGTILVGHETYGDNDLVTYDSRPVVERFTKLSNAWKDECFVKSIVRTKEIVDGENLLHFIHCFRLKDKKVCFDDGTECLCKKWHMPIMSEGSTSGNIVLKHYKTKTIEEYFKRHLGRTWGIYPFQELLTFDKCKERFFSDNDVTQEKLDYLEKLKNSLK